MSDSDEACASAGRRLARGRFDSDTFARHVFVWCVTVEVAFVLLDYHVNYGRLVDVGAIRRMTNIAREDGLASWFGTTQTVFLALTTWGLHGLARATDVARWRRTGWLVVAVMLTYMAVDDGAQLHERVGTWVSTLHTEGNGSILDVFPSYAWQVVFLPVFAGFGLFLVVFLYGELRNRGSYRVVLAAVACLVLAVGLDFIEGLDEAHPMNVYTWVTTRIDLSGFTMARFRHTPYDTLAHFSRSLEEFLEMFAHTLVWTVLLRHVPVIATDVHVSFGPNPKRELWG